MKMGSLLLEPSRHTCKQSTCFRRSTALRAAINALAAAPVAICPPPRARVETVPGGNSRSYRAKVVVARSLDLAVSFDSVDRHGQCGHQAVGPASASDLPTSVAVLLWWVVPRRKSSGTLSASVASSSSPIGPSILPRSRPQEQDPDREGQRFLN